MRRELRGVRKERAGRFYQLLSGHAATAPHLRRIGQISTDSCWWCGSGKRQTRLHLFSRCRRWTPEIRRLWQRIEVDCEGGPRAPSVRRLFRDPRATPAVLDFLRDTRVGMMPGLELHGVREDELGREVELWAEDESSAEEGVEGEPGSPSGCTFSFVFSFLWSKFLFFFRGRRVAEEEHPNMTAQAGPGSGKGCN